MYDSQPTYNHDITFQNVLKGTSTTGYVEKLILFLETYLPSFQSEEEVNGDIGENDITSKLWKYLTRKCKRNKENKEYSFNFQPEMPQKKPNQKGHGSRIDMGAWHNIEDLEMQVIYCIEAKKLPTIGTGRTKEYVLGNKGGIQRFKDESHGLNDKGDLVKDNGIIAYITKDNFNGSS